MGEARRRRSGAASKSNIHANAYALGAVASPADMPVILGPHGPRLGGFVCPGTNARAERWKRGQLTAGDRLRFVPMTDAGGRAARRHAPRRPEAAHRFPSHPAQSPRPASRQSPILDRLKASEAADEIVYRRSGLRRLSPGRVRPPLKPRSGPSTPSARAHGRRLERNRPDGILDLTPGIRLLQIHFDPTTLPAWRLLLLLRDPSERALCRDSEEIVIPTRIVHLPLSWEDPATLVAIEKYTRSVRPDAPWCPSNIEFIRRINGIASVDDVRKIVFDASYMVLGLGDVYLGAPVATPLDPRHRLVTTKYNPARTWTPENAVGIGGAYLCIYGMEGPGGYQFVGRTLQVWNTHRQTADFREGKPYLLRFFDEIRFEPVEADELLHLREGFPYGKTHVRIEESSFRYNTYRAWLDERAGSIAAFKTGQQAAFEAERERWRTAGQDVVASAPPSAPSERPEPLAIPAGCTAVTSPIAGNVWKLATDVGAAGSCLSATLLVIVGRAMKTARSPSARAFGAS